MRTLSDPHSVDCPDDPGEVNPFRTESPTLKDFGSREVLRPQKSFTFCFLYSDSFRFKGDCRRGPRRNDWWTLGSHGRAVGVEQEVVTSSLVCRPRESSRIESLKDTEGSRTSREDRSKGVVGRELGGRSEEKCTRGVRNRPVDVEQRETETSTMEETEKGMDVVVLGRVTSSWSRLRNRGLSDRPSSEGRDLKSDLLELLNKTGTVTDETRDRTEGTVYRETRCTD